MQDIVFYLIKIDLKFLSLKKRFGNKGISGTVCNILIISNLFSVTNMWYEMRDIC
jgi:hypothetical protein